MERISSVSPYRAESCPYMHYRVDCRQLAPYRAGCCPIALNRVGYRPSTANLALVWVGGLGRAIQKVLLLLLFFLSSTQRHNRGWACVNVRMRVRLIDSRIERESDRDASILYTKAFLLNVLLITLTCAKCCLHNILYLCFVVVVHMCICATHSPG